MKILEILLPKGIADKSLSTQTLKRIDALQTRMGSYADKICKLSTGAARDFLMTKLKADYKSLKDILENADMSEDGDQAYEVYDTRTGQKVSGPYMNLKRASNAAEKHNLKFGAHRYTHRPIKALTEAVHTCPLSDKDFELVKKIMERPIPAVIATVYLHDIIDDDELNDQFKSLEDTDPSRDVRPLVADWFNRVMPDQLHRFGQSVAGHKQQMGILSPLHGYDPHMYKGSSFTGTGSSGNAYGRA